MQSKVYVSRAMMSCAFVSIGQSVVIFWMTVIFIIQHLIWYCAVCKNSVFVVRFIETNIGFYPLEFRGDVLALGYVWVYALTTCVGGRCGSYHRKEDLPGVECGLWKFLAHVWLVSQQLLNSYYAVICTDVLWISFPSASYTWVQCTV